MVMLVNMVETSDSMIWTSFIHCNLLFIHCMYAMLLHCMMLYAI